MNEPQAEPKIVVDEDWKERVRAEREAARVARQAQQEHPGGQPQSERAATPPDEFMILVSTLATQAMIALGQLPDPAQGHAVVRPELAKHSIDTLAMLERKTQGNLTADESRTLDDVLHQLRMMYVSVYREPPEPGAGQTHAAGQTPSETGGEAATGRGEPPEPSE